MNRIVLFCASAAVASLASTFGLANGFFNGPITSGEAVSETRAREARLEDLIRSHDFCATEAFKDVYRQIYPFNGELIVALGQDRGSIPITENPEFLFASRGRERFLVATFAIGPKDDGSAQDLPPQLIFNVNVNSDYPPIGGTRPPLNPLGTVFVSESGFDSKISLRAPFPSLEFDYEKRTSGFDELGNPIDPRYVVSRVRAIARDSRGPATPFVNPLTNQRTAVTLNSDFFLECFASRVSAAASEF